MSQQYKSLSDVLEEFGGEINHTDVVLSQIDTGNVGNLEENSMEKNEELDEMDIIISQINTEVVTETEDTVYVDIESDIPDELLEQHRKAMEEVLPNKSMTRYLQAYDIFNKWRESKRTSSLDEKVIMAYFQEAGQRYKPSTLWSIYSMLKKTLIAKHNVNIAKYSQLSAWLKTKSDGYHCKQSNVFTAEEINKFIVEAPNEMYLGMKAVLAFGLMGVCRGIELTNLTVDNIRDTGIEFIVTISETKTNEKNRYIIDGEFANIVRQYISLRPPNVNTNRLFLQFRNGKCVQQVMGKHSIAKVPKAIATFLDLPNPETYTGHSYRRSGTTIAADAGASIEDLKRLGTWKSSSVAEKYIQDSIGYKRKLAHMISDAVDLPSTSSTDTSNGSTIKRVKNGPSLTSVKPSEYSGNALSMDRSLGTVATKKPFVALSSSVSMNQKSDSLAIKIPDNNESVIFHFAGECNNFTIIHK